MDVSEAIHGRRSCRSYDRERKVPTEALRDMVEAATWAPSGHNTQPWRFTVLTGQAKDSFMEFFRGDLECKKTCMTEEQANIALWSCSSLEKGDAVILVWDREGSVTSQQSIGACIQNMMLQAHSVGLASLWVGAVRWSVKEIKERYGRDWELICGLAVGYPSVKMLGKKAPPRLDVDEVAEFL